MNTRACQRARTHSASCVSPLRAKPPPRRRSARRAPGTPAVGNRRSGRDWGQGSRVLERPHSRAPNALTVCSPAQSTGCLIKVVGLLRGRPWVAGGGGGPLPPPPATLSGQGQQGRPGWGTRPAARGLGRRGQRGPLPPHSRGPPAQARVQRERLPLRPAGGSPPGLSARIPPSSQSFLS